MAADNQDPRLAAMEWMRDPSRPNPHALVSWPGPQGSPLHAHVKSAAAAGEKTLTKFHSVKTDRRFGPDEERRNIRAAALEGFAELEPILGKAAAVRDRLGAELRAATHLKPESVQQNMWYDLKRLDGVVAMSASEKAALVHGIAVDTMAHLPMAEAGLRLPEDLSFLPFKERTMARVELFRRFRPDEFLALEIQRQQLAATETALHGVVNAIRESGGHVTPDPAAHPRAFAALRGAPPALQWLPQGE